MENAAEKPTRVEVGQRWMHRRSTGIRTVEELSDDGTAHFETRSIGFASQMLTDKDWSYYGWAPGYGPQPPAVRQECPTHKRTWDEIKNIPGWACPSCLALDPGFTFAPKPAHFCGVPCYANGCPEGRIKPPSLRAPELTDDNWLPASALELIQDRKPPEPWRPNVDDWDLLPDA